MTLANVALTDTFDTWRTRTNQLVSISNDLIEGKHITSGTINSTNTGAAINVTAGYIQVKSNVFSSNAFTLSSNIGTVTVSGTGRLGTIIYLDVVNTNVSDQSTSNVATANTVNAVNRLLITNYNTSNGAFYHANAAFAFANGVSQNATAAFNLANTLNQLSSNQATILQQAWTTGNGAFYHANAAFDRANAANLLAFTTGIGANNYANASFYTIANGTAANVLAFTAFNHANAAFDRANAANVLAFNALARTGGTVTGNITFSGHTITFTSNLASQTLTDQSTINWNLSNGTVATVTLGDNRTLANPTNLRVGSYILHIYQDGVGGRTLNFSSSYKWPAGFAPPLSTDAGAHDVFSFVCDGINMYGSFLPDVK